MFLGLRECEARSNPWYHVFHQFSAAAKSESSPSGFIRRGLFSLFRTFIILQNLAQAFQRVLRKDCLKMFADVCFQTHGKFAGDGIFREDIADLIKLRW